MKKKNILNFSVTYSSAEIRAKKYTSTNANFSTASIQKRSISLKHSEYQNSSTLLLLKSSIIHSYFMSMVKNKHISLSENILCKRRHLSSMISGNSLPLLLPLEIKSLQQANKFQFHQVNTVEEQEKGLFKKLQIASIFGTNRWKAKTQERRRSYPWLLLLDLLESAKRLQMTILVVCDQDNISVSTSNKEEHKGSVY